MFIKKNVRTMKMHCALLVDDWMLKMKTHKIFSFIFFYLHKKNVTKANDIMTMVSVPLPAVAAL